jgi:heme oxygenase
MTVDHLRETTHSHHRALERELDLLRPSFTRGDYVALLRAFHGFYAPWEEAIEARIEPALPGFFGPRRKRDALEADLCSLGHDAERLCAIARCRRLPPLRTVGEALGSMYVIEGSTLGGRILAPHFCERLGLRPDAGCRFFTAYGGRAGAMWRAFGEVVAARPEEERGFMAAAAVSTFEALGAWLRAGAGARAAAATVEA